VTLVQAISLLRQKKGSEVVQTVHNLLSQYRAFPQTVVWDRKEEIKDLYVMHTSQAQHNKMFKEVAEVLGLSINEIASLKENVDSEIFKSKEDQFTNDELRYFG
jgi:hypothetical protein